MVNFAGAFVLLFTVITSMGLGIIAAYGSIIIVLSAFGGRRKTAATVQHNTPLPVLMTQEIQASGD